MKGELRRVQIVEELKNSSTPVSASRMAAQLGVSRQVIVGDVALLRAQGKDIIATARGYLLVPVYSGSRYIGKLPCQHSPEQTFHELATIVRLGGEVLDVVVEHDLYGEITGQLNISTIQDVEYFLQRVQAKQTGLLSQLTGGVHLHTVACRDKAAFDNIQAELEQQSILYRSSD